MKSTRLFSRGLNYHGQCGLGKNLHHTNEKFIEVKNIPRNIHSIYSGMGHNAFLLEGDIFFFLIFSNF
jgi:hypothetical protein